jgi:serine/threonine-protein kinase HipA
MMEGTETGRLEEDGRGRLRFAYDRAWLARPDAVALSHSLPLVDGAQCEGPSRTYFAGLLPEGPVRSAAAARAGVGVDDDLGLLAALGRDCAGAVRLLPAEAPDVEPVPPLWLSEADLAARLRALASRPLGFSAAEDVRTCLAGAQDKLPVVVDAGGRTGLPRGGGATTHVLKVQVDGLGGTHVNEALCLALARALGLPAADASLRRAEDVSYLAVRRYDRVGCPGRGPVRRIHQEDVCEALALPPHRKYRYQGGPTLEDCVALIRATSARSDVDLGDFLRSVALDYLTGNHDAHGKNLSLLRLSSGEVRLAPRYDLGCTVIYPGLSGEMAMPLGGEGRPELVRGMHWRRLAESAGVPAVVLAGWLIPLATGAPALAATIAAELEAAGWGGVPAKVAAVVAHRATLLERALGDLASPGHAHSTAGTT